MKVKAKLPHSAAASRATKRIIVVDDHPLTCEGVAHLLRSEPGLAVVGVAATAKAALHLVRAKSPHLVLTDLSLAESSGLELVKDLHAQFPQVAVLVFSMHYESLYAERVLRAGARGYIMKSEGAARLLAAVRRVLQGEVYLSEVMRDRAVHRFGGSPATREGDHAAALSDRELEVFELIGQAFGTRQIAAHLRLSTSTVETHRAHLKEKLHLHTATELVRAAVEWVDGRQR
ncbi:response regulator [Horticoccus sp. 23ND18S-11]|uniref:response regulator n=1 Tax=Horticoccus sp. 23ND18S-11 TaxID=3391832 RepID=UPI0039C9DCB0